MNWNRKTLIQAYLDFFTKKAHKLINNARLIPENDSTVLFTTAGMHPLVPYLLSQPHPQGKKLVSIQKCIRTQDIDEIGDSSHHTFFEMLGNWSLGDYWKKEAIEMSLEFLTKTLKIPNEKLAVSCFKGDKDAKKDEESSKVWESLGIKKERIAFLPKENNWWGPAGSIGPCGPDTEMFFWIGKGKPSGNPGTNEKNWREIWNDVFMQYNKTEQGKFLPLKQKNVDTGMGVERTVAILNGFTDNYLTEIWQPIIKQIEKLSKKKYGKNQEETRAIRIIADHLKAATFILAEQIQPSNKEQGYVLRRLIRRAVRYGKFLMMQNNFTSQIAKIVISIYDDYPHLKKQENFILSEIEKEESRFRQSLQSGLNFFNKIIKEEKGKTISGKDAFLLYQSYGFPLELTLELAKEKKLKVDTKEYEKELLIHQEKSRTATQGKFKSGLADSSEQTTKLHTAAHLLNQALRTVLGKQDIFQKGSNITPERLRFDFNFDRKLTEQELREVENLVNSKIKAKLPIIRKEMSLVEAKKSGAQGVFEHKYGDKVFVYIIGEFSKEICAGPHVSNTCQLGKFKIIKEESVAAGVRRIKAVLEN